MTDPSSVLVLTNALGRGGAERWSIGVTAELARRGIRTTLAAAPGPLVDDVDRAVTYLPAPLDRGAAGLPAAIAAVARLRRRVQPAVVLTHSVGTTLAARATDPFRRTPLVAVAHGWPGWRYPAVAPLLRAADRVVAVSAEVGARLVDHGLDRARVSIVPNGIDLSPFEGRPPEVLAAARRTLGADPDDVLVISVGRCVAQKRQERVVDAAIRLARTHPRLRWAIVGDGPSRAALRARVDDAHLGDRVRLPGWRDDVADLLLASDLYVCTSDWEGMPLAVIEAMAARLAVISTDVEGIATLLDDGAGIRVPVGDAGALDATIGQLADDEPARLALGARARARVAREFSEAGMVDRLLAVLRAAGR